MCCCVVGYIKTVPLVKWFRVLEREKEREIDRKREITSHMKKTLLGKVDRQLR